jgi:hypothetical protein
VIKDDKGAAVCAVVCFWYENLLVVAGSAFVRTRLLSHIEKAARRVNAQFKLNEDGSSLLLGVNQAKYVGIHFKRLNNAVSWRHID